MFSKACEYALRATIFLAQKSSEEKKLSVDEVAAGTDAPRPFAAKILQQLHREKVILSTRGPSGGFYLTQTERALPVWRVLQAFREDERLTNCVIGLHQCTDHKPCPLHANYKEIKAQAVALFQQKRIADLAEVMQKTKAYIRHQ